MMGNDKVEGYAEGFKVGWNSSKQRIIGIINNWKKEKKYINKYTVDFSELFHDINDESELNEESQRDCITNGK